MEQTTITSDGATGDGARNVQGSASAVRDQVTLQFHQVAANQELRLQALSDGLPLLESGLDSLCFAIIVAELEDALGLDPFSDADEVFFPVTFGDFVALYEAAALKKAA
jgi:acyl carrier protein